MGAQFSSLESNLLVTSLKHFELMIIWSFFSFTLLICYLVVFYQTGRVLFAGDQQFGVLLMGSTWNETCQSETDGCLSIIILLLGGRIGEQFVGQNNRFYGNPGLMVTRKQPFESSQHEENVPTEFFQFSNETWSWKDRVRNSSIHIDYDLITKTCIQRLTGEHPDSRPYYVVYHADTTVGFANQFRALSGVFLVALVTGRRLRSSNRVDGFICS